MANPAPVVGKWYARPGGDSFEIVAFDRDDGTIEIQYFDGTIEELDLEDWREEQIVPAEPPEDWTGSVDVEPEDYENEFDTRARTSASARQPLEVDRSRRGRRLLASSNCRTSRTTKLAEPPERAATPGALASGRRQFGSSSGTLLVEQHVAVAHLIGNGCSPWPAHGPGDAFARFDLEQRAVHDAADQRRRPARGTRSAAS